MKHELKMAAALAALLLLAGCETDGSGPGLGGLLPDPGEGETPEPGGGGSGGALPVTASGKMLAVRLPSTVSTETSSLSDLPRHNARPTGAVAVDRTAADGVGISGSAEEDPDPNDFQGNEIAPPALISATADGPMEGGATFIGLDKAKGYVYFENGNFGDPQVESASAAISSVGVYNDFKDDGSVEQAILKDVTTIRYRDGNAGDAEANYGVGYVGNPTAAMPGSGTATYKGFYEQGIGVYAKADGSTAQMFMQGDAALTADFGAGTVKGGVSNGELKGEYDEATKSNPVLNPSITGIAIDATISGADYAGTAALVDSTGAPVGTVSHGHAIGGFFGADARETAAAVSIEGNAELGGAPSDYVLQGVIGGVKQ